MSVTADPLPQRVKEDLPLAKFADERHPLLRFALRDVEHARSYKVEWLSDRAEGGLKRWENYTQIFRTPFAPGDDPVRSLHKAVDVHLAEIEHVLWHGVPSQSLDGSHPRTTCGGALHFLGRAPLYADSIRLRPLQDMVVLKDRQAEGEPESWEILSELSLEVRPAPAIPYVPRADVSPRAWMQGESYADRDAA